MAKQGVAYVNGSSSGGGGCSDVKIRVKQWRGDSRVVSGEAGRSGEPERGTSAREVMGKEGREVGSGVERTE